MAVKARVGRGSYKAAHGVNIGHVHLKVANLARALAFYSDVLGLEVTQWYGEDAVFLSAGGYHHHIGLNTWERLGGSPPPQRTTGLYHSAFVYPTRADLAEPVHVGLLPGLRRAWGARRGFSESRYE